MKPYQIIEIANTHGGDLEYLLSLIDEFEVFEGFGIKFQPLHPDKIATSNYEWYPVYQELLFTKEEWNIILDRAFKTKEIWLDIFDTYGVEIFNLHNKIVNGIKLQSSVLFNQTVIDGLSREQLKDHCLIINVSGFDIETITERLEYFNSTLKPKELWIEVGFQSYPTELIDSGYVKIETIKKHFTNKIVFADHVDGKSEEAIWLPILAAMKGADVIEKHVMHSIRETKYDHYSSVTLDKYKKYIDKLKLNISFDDQPFINERERKYLENSIQTPIASKDIEAGELLSFTTDLQYKRSGQKGLNVAQLIKYQKELHVLSQGKKEGQAFQSIDFKKATIATIIACRLKSSRLPKKALLKIGELTSVEKCIESCLQFANVNHTILATSNLEEDAELEFYTHSSNVIFHKGDPEDVIRRYLDIIDKLKIDIVIRVTADMPFVSHEIVEKLLESHFRNGADYTVAKEAIVGTAPEIINTSALRKVKNYFPEALYSEYMTWYFQNNPDHFKLNFVSLPNGFIRNYRLTLDYNEDLILFQNIQNSIDQKLINSGLESIVNYLDTNPEIANINSHLTLKYKTDKELIDTLNRETRMK